MKKLLLILFIVLLSSCCDYGIVTYDYIPSRPIIIYQPHHTPPPPARVYHMNHFRR